MGWTTRMLLPELWLMVFPHLRASDLESVSQTCSAFRFMAQPLLFSVLDISPFLLSYNAEQPILRPRPYLDRLRQRIEHYTRPHIAHGVRHCWISPYSRTGFPSRNQQDDLDPNQVIDIAVAALPLFPNLSALSWHCIDISPAWWRVISALPLTHLWLNSSSIPDPPATPLPAIVHLDLDQWPWEGRVTNHVSIHEERTQGVTRNTLQHIVHPTQTQSISVPRPDTASRLFSVLAESPYALQTLNIPFSAIPDPNFVPALEHCVSLESLSIFPPSSEERHRDIHLDAFRPSALPALRTYHGPYTHVIQFSNQPLKDISLWGFDERPALCDPNQLVKILRQLAASDTGQSLQTLQLSVVGLTHSLLESFLQFNHLDRLLIQSQDTASRNMPVSQATRSSAPITTLYAMMEDVLLPPTLKYFKLTTRMSSPKLDLAAQERDAASFTEAIARKHPSIQRVELAYGIYWTGMYSAVWGRTRENADTDSVLDEEFTAENNKSLISKDEGGYSSKSSSKDYILSTVVSTVHPLPLGKLTFTEHRRTILFQHDTAGMTGAQEAAFTDEDMELGRLWKHAWTRLRRFFSRTGS